MLFSESIGRKVVSTSTADTVGAVGAFLVDPRSRTVAGLQIKKSKTGDALMWSGISTFGTDAVTVDSADRIVEIGTEELLSELDGKAHRVIGKRVLSTAGVDLGTVDDVEFDPETGTITSVIVDSVSIQGSTLTGVGSYAVVLDHRGR
ncbi:PRC-barrel domain-containing protein [Rhodococcus sp. NPDC078407]|uniref:PRC-barrel domain-containing protein n=1 Tax=Rhodococcus sp. NPDC078407 TaxID=3364509 RepID=UPI0037C6E3BB